MPTYNQAAISFTGTRFKITYSYYGKEEEARKSAEATCVEQTIEFPPELLPDNDYWRTVKGNLEDFSKIEELHYLATISYPVETISPDILQTLNVIYGNSAMIRNIQVEDADFPPEVLNFYKGPRFGLKGIRQISGVKDRPMICSTIKPMGLSVESFSEIAYESAIGGADIVKDDHGLTNQPLSNFKDRVSRCAQAILKANAETGENCIYTPNITAPVDQIVARAHYAKDAGAQALMVIPGLIGWDVVRLLSENDELALPILCHPAYYGIFFSSIHAGFSGSFAYSILPRLVGADIMIMPNYIGRLYSTKEECQKIVIAAKREMGHLRPILPAPGGGITLENIPELANFYGKDVLFIMGGGLHRGPSLVNSCRKFRSMLISEHIDE